MAALLKQKDYEAGDAPDGDHDDYDSFMVRVAQVLGEEGNGRMLVQSYCKPTVGTPAKSWYQPFEAKVVQLIAQEGCCFGPDRKHPRYLNNFDLTVCCVAFYVGKDGQLHWLKPHAKDILNGVLDATPFLCSLDLGHGTRGTSKKRVRTIERVLKYSLRGFQPTAKLLKLCHADVEDELNCSVAALRLC